ncbi:MAG: LamG domain-containing protein, partial [Crocinitomicaceae bacterium]|nr:LamG domain-containing protein [Crocinitomicaceae bacterium]
MITRLLLVTTLLISVASFSQDTTWVQTFTYDSISTRRADFAFPTTLNDQRFEKVLMYYTLKCDPQTPWDSYNCGEWDYLAYTRIFDHTGDMDSIQVDSVRYLNNYLSTPNYTYEPFNGNRMDTYVRIEQQRSGASTMMSQVLTGSGFSANTPFDVSTNGDRFQMLVTGTELSAAGITAGDLQSLSLFVPVGGITGNGELLYPSISMKSTTDNDLTAFHRTGFTEVYNLSRTAGAGPEFVNGENELLFYQPYNWNGTDNLIIEFYFESASGGQSNMIQFENEATVGSMALAHGARNGVMNFDGSNHALFELSDIDLGNDVTIAFWAKGMGNIGVNTSIIEGYDTLNNRVMNVHFPWSNNRLYWDCGKGNGYDRIDKDMSATGIDNGWHHWAFVKNQGTGEMKVFLDGVVWHSGTGLTRSIGNLHRLVIGANRSMANHWTGKVDNFTLFDVAVDDATIAAWYNKEVTSSHPNWNDILISYTFDDNNIAFDQSPNNYKLMPSSYGMIDFSEVPVTVNGPENRPVISFGQGTVTGAAVDVEVPFLMLKEPETVFEFAQLNNHFEIVSAFYATPEGAENVYDASNTLISSIPFSGMNTLNNSAITYYESPFEIIYDVEIGRFITP